MKKYNIIEKYLLKDDLSTYDPYDIWKTDIGVRVKRLYFKNKYLGVFPAAALTLYDLYLNNSFRIGYTKQEYPIVRAQICLSLLNFYKKEKNNIYLEHAKKHIKWLIKNSSKGYSGYCWGTGFRIVISDKLIYDETIPFSTNTPYILECMYEYYKITKDSKILDIIKSIYEFYENDLIVLKESDNILIISYGPFKDRIVTNAVSYTMFAYSIFYKLLDNKEYIKNKIQKMANFIFSVQNDDGSWLYSPYEKNSFIDCFHSVFILKNLIKTLQNVEINIKTANIDKGYIYLKNNFFNIDYGLFKRFSISNKPSLTKFDLYDNAEFLYLAKLIKDKEMVVNLTDSIEKYFISNDEIYSVIDIFGLKKNKMTLRWAVSPYILAKSL